jgi:hypothetical protein
MQGVGSTCASPVAGGVVTCRGKAAAKGQVLALAQLGPRQGEGRAPPGARGEQGLQTPASR